MSFETAPIVFEVDITVGGQTHSAGLIESISTNFSTPKRIFDALNKSNAKIFSLPPKYNFDMNLVTTSNTVSLLYTLQGNNTEFTMTLKPMSLDSDETGGDVDYVFQDRLISMTLGKCMITGLNVTRMSTDIPSARVEGVCRSVKVDNAKISGNNQVYGDNLEDGSLPTDYEFPPSGDMLAEG